MSEVTIIDPTEATSFEEFWPYYVSQHLEPGTRKLHAIGTTLALLVFVRGLFKFRLRKMLLAPLVGYAFAWTGHFAIEGNKPATIGNPLWSLQADFRLLVRTIDGSIDAEVEAVKAALAAAPTAETDSPLSETNGAAADQPAKVG